MNLLYRLNHWIAKGIVALIIGMVTVMLAALSLQVVMRYVFGIALSWSEELSLAMFTWSVLLASALGVREGYHVRMSLVVDRLSGRGRREHERLIHLCTAVFGGYLAWSGWEYLTNTRGMTSAALGYPIEFLYAAGPACGGLIFLFALEAAIKGLVPAGEEELTDHV